LGRRWTTRRTPGSGTDAQIVGRRELALDRPSRLEHVDEQVAVQVERELIGELVHL
jgi:hypothetical protein